MILIRLFLMFFKIGLFSFGGGYAMIPLIQEELEINGWIEVQEFADMVAVSQMTPGPVAVNTATYVGVKVAGIAGSAFSTLGVSLPSFILVTLIARFFEKFKENRIVESVLSGIRPVSIGLISSAVVFFARLSIITLDISFERIKDLFKGHTAALSKAVIIHPAALFIFILILIAVKRFKVHPILAVIGSALLGIALL